MYSAWSGTRKAFCPTYLVGTAISRLFIPLYFLGCPRNFIWTVFSVPADFKNSSTVATLVLGKWAVISSPGNVQHAAKTASIAKQLQAHSITSYMRKPTSVSISLLKLADKVSLFVHIWCRQTSQSFGLPLKLL